ncbi:hypothetical protein XA68_11026 [Ophiocordyceps unilateralis]|uniref:Uncharacterized protein n=1 Tax=Ophiocordyceps unilateralis TaxID=268505 RepID=A0A2A9PGR6_OPHUN|nr:hypothetical protein XA68_11026 [Ophiocordyceps unilateralis]
MASTFGNQLVSRGPTDGIEKLCSRHMLIRRPFPIRIASPSPLIYLGNDGCHFRRGHGNGLICSENGEAFGIGSGPDAGSGAGAADSQACCKSCAGQKTNAYRDAFIHSAQPGSAPGVICELNGALFRFVLRPLLGLGYSVFDQFFHLDALVPDFLHSLFDEVVFPLDDPFPPNPSLARISRGTASRILSVTACALLS